jgi:hypothetical protein
MRARRQFGVAVLWLAALALLLAGTGRAEAAFAFNPTGGGLGGTTNFGSLAVGFIDELPGNAIAVGYFGPGGSLPAVGSTFTLDYQANVQNLANANGNPIFAYGTSGNTGQLTAVASFTERVTSVTATGVTFQTIGSGNFSLYFNPTRAANNQTGTDFAPGTTGNTLSAASFTQVYSGPILSGTAGNFSLSSMSSGALDQSPAGTLTRA